MSTFARLYREKIGTMQGDIEVAMFKKLRAAKKKSIDVVDDNGHSHVIHIAESPETHQKIAVFVDYRPAMTCSVEDLTNALEVLENAIDEY